MKYNLFKQRQSKKISITPKLIFISIWHGILGLAFPIVFGITFMLLTGHGKGYDYNLGSEVSVSVAIGLFLSLIWLLISLPSFMWTLFRYCEHKKKYILIPYLVFILMVLVSVLMIGVSRFLSFFGV